MSADLVDSVQVGEWGPGLVNLCNPAPPDPCDCGFVGQWEHRWVLIWNEVPGYQRPDWSCRRDLREGRPPRPKDEGWWVIGGHDERCPGCGDVERFDTNANEVARFAEKAKVVVFLDARRPTRNGSSGRPEVPR